MTRPFIIDRVIGHMLVPRQGMTDQHRIGAVLIELTKSFIGDLEGLKAVPRIELQAIALLKAHNPATWFNCDIQCQHQFSSNISGHVPARTSHIYRSMKAGALVFTKKVNLFFDFVN